MEYPRDSPSPEIIHGPDHQHTPEVHVPPEQTVERLALWMILEAAELNLLDGNLSPADVEDLLAEYDRMNVAGLQHDGRKNAIVPWDDPQIPFECGCGCIIYSDTEHEC